VRASGTNTQIRWAGSTTNVLEREDNGRIRVEYKTRLVVNNKEVFPLNLILTLIPIQKTDRNTDGVAVMDYTDIGQTPFVEGVTE